MSKHAYARVFCRGDLLGRPNKTYSCGAVDLTEDQYAAQMERPNSVWMCPQCGSTAHFDDDYYERLHYIDEEDDCAVRRGES